MYFMYLFSPLRILTIIKSKMSLLTNEKIDCNNEFCGKIWFINLTNTIASTHLMEVQVMEKG